MRAFETAPADLQELLNKPISQLGLQLEASPLERSIQQLYRELERKGLRHFRPRCYLTDEWGCPDGEPVIGIPFYLADPKLARLEKEMNDLEDARQVMMYLRHEAGHAFNYAYELYKTHEWREVFGSFRRAYRDNYRPVPFSRSFVRHMEGWYAQKHPDEDFAETFAVWLTPNSRWRRKYRGWPAMRKLRYMERIARKLGDVPPKRPTGQTDVTASEMNVTVGEFYQRTGAQDLPLSALALDTDLLDIFIASKKRRRGVRPAADMMSENRKALIDKITYWTGVQRPIIKQLVEGIRARVAELGLKVETRCESEHLAEFAVYVTALCMNYLWRGKFVQP